LWMFIAQKGFYKQQFQSNLREHSCPDRRYPTMKVQQSEGMRSAEECWTSNAEGQRTVPYSRQCPIEPPCSIVVATVREILAGRPRSGSER
jgi:hypothetical protein